MKKRCIRHFFVILALIIMLFFELPAVLSLSIQIQNVGQLGFGDTNPEFTSLRSVILKINYTPGYDCRFSNDNVSWSNPEPCYSEKYWLLSDGAGQKIVYALFNNTGATLPPDILNDTIYFNYTGSGLDTSPPTNVVITYDPFSNINSSASFSWSEADDPESDLLKIPLIYSYRIQKNGVVNSWTVLGTERSVDYVINLTHGDNVTILVNATNSAGLNSQTRASTIIDLVQPNDTQISSDMVQGVWHSNETVFFNWLSSDNLSGIKGYSYTLSTDDSIEPDNIPEGDSSLDLSNQINATFSSLDTGVYKFKIRAIDNAGNSGNITSYDLWMDKTPPSKPELLSSDMVFGTQIINYTWSESYDEDSGINHFTIEIWNNTDYNYSTSDLLTSLNISKTKFNYEYLPSENYTNANFYARVKAIDNVGNPSVWSSGESLYDSIPPIITPITPNGNTEGANPVIRLITDEKANCYLNDSGVLTMFEYTNSTYHETKPKNGVYTVSCFDLSGNVAEQTIGFNSVAPPGIYSIILTPVDVYTGQVSFFNISTNTGGIDKKRFNAYLNNSRIDFTITDKGNGKYSLNIIAPKEEGIYSLRLTITDLAGDIAGDTSEDITVNSLNLVATYTGTFTKIDSERVTYYTSSDYSSGFSSDSKVMTLGSQDDFLNISALYDGKIYFFATKSIQSIETKDKQMKEKTFLTQKKPSFGYSQSAYITLQTTISYPNINLIGSESLEIGSYTLVIKRLKNENKKTVLVTTKLSNYNDQGVMQYD